MGGKQEAKERSGGEGGMAGLGGGGSNRTRTIAVACGPPSGPQPSAQASVQRPPCCQSPTATERQRGYRHLRKRRQVRGGGASILGITSHPTPWIRAGGEHKVECGTRPTATTALKGPSCIAVTGHHAPSRYFIISRQPSSVSGSTRAHFEQIHTTDTN